MLAQRLRAERRNHVRALDFQFDQTADGRNLKLLNIVDEYTREALQMLVARRVDADSTVATREQPMMFNGVPELIRCDSGPELTAHALRDWCRLGGTGAAFIDPGAPWQNPFVESFHARVRDELLDVEQFVCLAEAQVVIEDWRQDYNTNRRHSSLGMRSPATFAAALTSQTTPIRPRRSPLRDPHSSRPPTTVPNDNHPRLSLRMDRRTGPGHEFMRCLERYIAREVYNSLRADLADTNAQPRPPIATTIMCGNPGFGINRTRT